MNNFKDKFPNLVFDDFFDGKVIAKGHLIQYYPTKIIKNIFIEFNGKYKDDNLAITENYHESENKIVRKWKFKKISANQFIGEEENVNGKIRVAVNKNTLQMNYLFNILFKKIPITVKVKDDMYLVEKNVIINCTIVSKYKIKLAETFLYYKKIS